jgi:hypothetical protein
MKIIGNFGFWSEAIMRTNQKNETDEIAGRTIDDLNAISDFRSLMTVVILVNAQFEVGGVRFVWENQKVVYRVCVEIVFSIQ